MRYLVDTNVLLWVVNRHDAQHTVARSAVRRLREAGHTLHATPQSCIELWNVATRSVVRNRLGLAPDAALHPLRLVERSFPLLPDTLDVYLLWRRLVVTFKVSGVQVHDARLVAVMQSHALTYILTFNSTDFARYASEGIVVVTPSSISA